MTETPLPVAFDPRTLETLGVADAARRARRHRPPAPRPGDGELVNAARALRRRAAATRLARGAGRALAHAIAAVPVARARPTCTASRMTERYVVLVAEPARRQPAAARARRTGRSSRTTAGRPSAAPLHRVDRDDRRARRHAGRPTRCSPSTTSTRSSATASSSSTCAPTTTRDHRRALPRPAARGAANALPAARPQRLRLPLGGGAARLEPLADADLELPRIDYAPPQRPPVPLRLRRRGTAAGFRRIVKVDVDDGAVARWREDGCLPRRAGLRPRAGRRPPRTTACCSPWCSTRDARPLVPARPRRRDARRARPGAGAPPRAVRLPRPLLRRVRPETVSADEEAVAMTEPCAISAAVRRLRALAAVLTLLSGAVDDVGRLPRTARELASAAFITIPAGS